MTLEPPGYFGKVPARGDFVCRRIAPALAETWDAWLALLTNAVRDAAGDAWPEAWLTAPLWHFALGGALAPFPGAAGVLVASVDRVGRFFPFTIIAPASGIPDESWSDAIETIALDALNDDFDPDRLDADLAQLGSPAAGEPLERTQSLWRCRGSDLVEPTSRLMPGLPGPVVAAGMVLGSRDPET